MARVLLKNPPMVIVNEAIWKFDSDTQRRPQLALRRPMDGPTTSVIAPRLAVLNDMDRIVVLDRGGIIDMGRHEELLDEPGLSALLQ